MYSKLAYLYRLNLDSYRSWLRAFPQLASSQMGPHNGNVEPPQKLHICIQNWPIYRLNLDSRRSWFRASPKWLLHKWVHNGNVLPPHVCGTTWALPSCGPHPPGFNNIPCQAWYFWWSILNEVEDIGHYKVVNWHWPCEHVVSCGFWLLQAWQYQNPMFQ
jgi:hypothetical protein